MEIFIGGIYEISEEWHPYDTQLVNHRPVIVIDVEHDYVEILLMGILHNFSNREKSVMFEVQIRNRKFISVVATDVVHRISKEYLKSNIGYVEKEVIDIIYEKQGRNLRYKKVEKVKDEEIHEVIVTDESVFYESLLKIEEHARVMRAIVEENNSPVNIWKERFFGFFVGILSSVIATFLSEELAWDDFIKVISDFVKNVINK